MRFSLLFLLCFLMTDLTAQVPAGVDCPATTGGDPAAPFPVCDVTAVITHGPYLSAPTDSSAIITWTTDRAAHVRVLYGEGDSLKLEAVSARHGMLDVGTVHRVRLSGLKPGREYRYRIVVNPVLELLSYWPKKGVETVSKVYTFRTFSPALDTVRFVATTDLHESLPRIRSVNSLIDWSRIDFFAFTGDAFNGLTSERQLWERWLDPLIDAGMSTVPMLYARGNHDTRGGFARQLDQYVPIEEGRFYFSRDIGPLHMIVLDTGEDKPDSTQVYARLNAMAPYRQAELSWFREHVGSDQRMRSAPFRVILMHQPQWGALGGDQELAEREWTTVANQGKVDLVIAGHDHRFSLTQPGGPGGNNFPILVVGQGQIAQVEADAHMLVARVIDSDGTVVNELRIPASSR